jgi:hypothetical protein
MVGVMTAVPVMAACGLLYFAASQSPLLNEMQKASAVNAVVRIESAAISDGQEDLYVSVFGKIGATASLDIHCARRRLSRAGRGEETGSAAEQRN